MGEPMGGGAEMAAGVQEPMEEPIVRVTFEQLTGLKGSWRDKRAAKAAATEAAAAAAEEAAATEAAAIEAKGAAAIEAAAIEATIETEGYNWAGSEWWAEAKGAAATADACGFCAAWGFAGVVEAMSGHIGSEEPWRWVVGGGWCW